MPDLTGDTPWASYCMSTYRRTAFLKKTLSLIRTQTFVDFEVVISDNDPESSAAAVVAEFQDPRFRYFPNNANLGMIRSFNKSIERSRGQFIVMITDDDPVYSDMLQVLYDLHLNYPGYGLYFGGHDTLYTGVLPAKMAKARVGTNSALTDWDLGAVKVFEAAGFAHAFLDGTIAGGLLWSTGIIRRDIVLAIGGVPDYGTPPLADCALILLSGARGGCVYVNKALGYRTIHDDNDSYREANYENVYKAPEAFYKWSVDRLPPAVNTPAFQRLLAHYVGRDMTIVVISIKKKLLYLRVKSPEFEKFRRRFFDLPFLRKWKMKYYIAVHYPDLFELFLTFRRMLFSSRNQKKVANDN